MTDDLCLSPIFSAHDPWTTFLFLVSVIRDTMPCHCEPFVFAGPFPSVLNNEAQPRPEYSLEIILYTSWHHFNQWNSFCYGLKFPGQRMTNLHQVHSAESKPPSLSPGLLSIVVINTVTKASILGEDRVYLAYTSDQWWTHHREKPEQELMKGQRQEGRNIAYCHMSYITQNHLPKGGTTQSGQSPPTSHQDSAP